jgi:hypothetical protein
LGRSPHGLWTLGPQPVPRLVPWVPGACGGPLPQNLMLPIIPAMFVVRSLIVGAIVEEAR